MITVETRDAAIELPELLVAVEERGETVVICRHGNPIAELRAAPKIVAWPSPLTPHPQLKAKINYDPVEAATEDEWPEHLR